MTSTMSDQGAAHANGSRSDNHEGRPAAAVTQTPDEDSTSIEVGTRLRDLRTGRRLTQRVVAERAGISEGFLSQIELGRSTPSLKTFRRIAQALGLEAADVLDNRDIGLPRLVPRHGGNAVDIGALSKYRITPPIVSSMEVVRGVFEGGVSAGEAYTHGTSDEIAIVLSGALIAEVNGEKYSLSTGDTLCYRSEMPHTFHNPSGEPAEVIWIITPPSY